MDRTETPVESSAASVGYRRRERPDLAPGLRAFLVLDAAVRLLVWCGAFALSTALFTALELWPSRGPFGADLPLALFWAGCLALWILLFNAVYVLELVLLRTLLPTPEEGRYSTASRRPSRQIIWSCLIAALTKARLDAPFPGFLVFHLANLPPLVWLMGPVFGPRSRSCYATEPRILDPHLVTIGRNVVIGFNTTIAGHYQERDAVTFQRTTIADDVAIGGHCVIFGGVQIRRGAMIGAGAIVLPGTVVGENEFWAGVPARKLRDLPPLESLPASG